MPVDTSAMMQAGLSAVVVAACVGAATLAYKKIAKWLRNKTDDYNRIRDAVLGAPENSGLIAGHVELKAHIEDIRKELRTNGGASLKDLVLDSHNNSQLLLGLFQAAGNHDHKVAHIRTDSQGMLVWASRIYSLWLGRPMQELTGLRWLTLVHTHDRFRLRKEWDSVVLDGRSLDMQFRIWINPDKTYTLVRCTTDPVFGSNNKILGWYGSITRVG